MPRSIKKYAVIKDGVIKRILASADSIDKFKAKLTDFDEITEVPFDTEILCEDSIEEYEDNDLTKGKRPLFDRYKRGLIKDLDPELEVTEDNKIVEKSDAKLVKEGLRQLAKGQKLNEETGKIEYKPWAEQVADGDSTYEEWLNEVLRPARDQMLREVDVVHLNPERWESMPAQSKKQWADFKQALRDFPDTNPPVTEWNEIAWPKAPSSKIQISN